MIPQRMEDNLCILSPEGTVAPDDLQSQVQGLLADGQHYIALDLTTVTYIDSAGLGVLVGVHKQCETRGAVFCLYGLQSYVKRLVEVIRLNKVLRIFDTEADCLESLESIQL
jgi:anti-sigma B factor antagonist